MTSPSFLNLAFLCFFSLPLISRSQPTPAPSPGQSQPTPAPSPGNLPPQDSLIGGGRRKSVLCSVVRNHGYYCEAFKVTTDDGYILTVHRIPEGRDGGGVGRHPVLLQHGVLMDGMVWVASPPDQSLAMILADSGFDVWISNIRGTRFSRQHRKMSPDDPKFWHWTWDDLIKYDLPAILDLITRHTSTQIHYVGHSMGTLMALTSLSERKMTNVKSAALLSPIAYLFHVKTDVTLIAARAFLGELGAIFGMAEFNPKGGVESKFFKFVCKLAAVDCNEMKTTSITGKNCCLNNTVADNFMKHDPQPTATRNLIHFSQAIRHGFMLKYDYGNFMENMKHYGQLIPPIYNLSNIPRNFPLFMSYGGEDKLSDTQDVLTLLYQLKSHQTEKLKVQFVHNYAHLDFVLATNAYEVIYKDMIDFFMENE